MSEKPDPIIEAYNKVIDLIKETKNDKLYYAFLHLYELEVRDFRKQLEETKLYQRTALKGSESTAIKLNKIEEKLFDIKIENEHVFNKSSNELLGKMNTLQKAIIARPRFYGFGLILFGRSLIQHAKSIDDEQTTQKGKRIAD